MSRRPFVVGNWKMHLDRAGAVELARTVASQASGSGAQVGVCPPFIYLDAIASAVREAGDTILVGAQDGYMGDYGAFTGEVSMKMLVDLGVGLVLTGHSERRHVIGESDALVGEKTAAAVDAGLHCILCVGETIEQREAGETDAVNERQIRTGLAGIDGARMSSITIAYEPVWAIGTGKTATPEDAQAAHASIRALLGKLYGAEIAGSVRIQYGGSMKPANAPDLMSQPDIDGGLIGGAALKPDSFMAIVQAADAPAGAR
jgi:triosephosphate isomerase